MAYRIQEQRVLERFLRYVQVDSETGHEREMGKLLVQELEALGLSVTTDVPPEWIGTDGFNIYATLTGDSSLEAIVFSCHMDTVTPGVGIQPRVCEDGYVRSDGTTILGGDDKAGISAIVEAVTLAKDLPRHPTVELVITVREESGLLGSKVLDYSRIQSKRGVVLDSSGSPEKITTSAPGQNRISVTIHGARAHAGIAPEAGVSAIQVGCHAVAAMNLLRIDEETTCNIGTFVSEGPTNIVSPTASLVMEVRSRNMDKLAKQTAHMTDCVEEACKKFGATCEIEVTTSYEGFYLQDDHPLVEQTIRAATNIGLHPQTVGSGGGSDANEFNRHGIPTVNLGIGMEKVHTTEEQQNIQQMYQGAEICFEMIVQTLKG